MTEEELEEEEGEGKEEEEEEEEEEEDEEGEKGKKEDILFLVLRRKTQIKHSQYIQNELNFEQQGT